jgi:DNA-directed RNA polymerase specialized sigma24 family protein
VLVQRARRDPRAALSLLALVEPELRSIYRHLVRRGAEPEEAQAVTVSVAWEVVSGHRGRRRPSSPSGLINAIWAEIRRDAGLRRNGGPQRVPLTEAIETLGFDVPAPKDDPIERWPGLLAAAVSAGVITARQAALVAETRVEERPLAEVAKALGRPYDAVRMERGRVEVALRAFAPSYLSGGGS